MEGMGSKYYVKLLDDFGVTEDCCLETNDINEAITEFNTRMQKGNGRWIIIDNSS